MPNISAKLHFTFRAPALRLAATLANSGPTAVARRGRDRTRYCATALILVLSTMVLAANAPSAPGNLEILQAGYPRSFIFWYNTRDLVSHPNLDQQALDWELLKLNGIMSPSSNWGKVIDYKERHPEKLVFLFTQGQVVSEQQSQYVPLAWSDFFAGHWVYLEGCKITQDLPADGTADLIHVENPSLFQRERPSQFRDERMVADMMICRVGAGGKLDFATAEQIQLLSIDNENRTLRVKRACYGTKPVALKANQGWAALHAYADWGYQGGVSWYLNYSLACPTDKHGNTASDILFSRFTSLFKPGGVLAKYDGLEFDAVNSTVTRTRKKFETDGDTVADNGYRNGLNVYGIGHYNFIKRLRDSLGDTKLIMADGLWDASGVRFLSLLNGIEFEWWPSFNDLRLDDWSNGMNFHSFVRQNSRQPHFTYINHKVGGESRQAGEGVPMSIHRCVFAAAQFLDAVLTVHPTALPKATDGDSVLPVNHVLHPSYSPDHVSKSAVYPVWDEFVKGVENRKNWLGLPLAPPVRLALEQPDLLKDAGKQLRTEFLQRFQGDGLAFTQEKDAIRISAKAGGPLKFTINSLPCGGPDLFLSFKIKSSPMTGYPEDYTRVVRLRSSSGTPDQSFHINRSWFQNCVSFRRVSGSAVNISFDAEGDQPIWISDFSVHAYPDAIYRDFEHGLVLANPSDHDYEFDVASLLPGARLRRLRGTPGQDPKTNNGMPVGGKVTLGPRDGLFLVKE